MANITLQGEEFHTNGNLPEVGKMAPDFVLVNRELQNKSLKDFTKKTLISIVPSLDTPVCALSTEKFNQTAQAHEDTDFLIVSSDLPFAMARFCNDKSLDNVVPLSMMRSRDFATDYGVLITDGPLAGIAARALLVLDTGQTVIHAELVTEISDEPDYEAAFAALK